MKLVRVKSTPLVTLGLLDGTWWTVENPWLDNQVRVSCIPAGVYTVKRHESPSKGLCWSVPDVLDRTFILIHVANWAKDVLGCIGVGTGIVLANDMVTSSKDALKQMLDELPDEWELEIVDAF